MAGERLFQRLDAEIRRQRDRQPPGQDLAAEPIDHGGQINEAAGHRNVGDVHRPDLVSPRRRYRPRRCEVAEQVRADLVARRRFRRVRTAVERRDRHLLHQRRDVEPTHRMAFGLHQAFQHPAPGKGIVQRPFTGPAHQREIGVRGRARQVIDAAPADAERLRLAADAQLGLPVDHRLALGGRPALPSAPDIEAGTVAPVWPRKLCGGSFSSVSSPLFACSVFTSRAGVASTGATAPNTPDALSRSCERHCVIWFGRTSNCSASSASVFAPRMAANATQSSVNRSAGSISDPPHTLNAGLWFRRGRLVMGLSSLSAIMPMSRGQSTYCSPQARG